MEILSQTTHWGEYLFAMFAMGGGSIGLIMLFIGFLCTKPKEATDIAWGFGIFIAMVAFIGITVLGVMTGPNVTYTALITDFNEVYEQGYEITGKDGKLYTIRESEAD